MLVGTAARRVELGYLGHRLGIQGDDDLIVADAQDIAVLQPIAARAELRDRLRLIIDEHPVGAQVFEVEVSVAKMDAGVVRGHVAQRVGQHPIIVARAPDRAAAHAENDGVSLGEQPPVIADDAQAKRHGAPKSSGLCCENPSPLRGRGSFPGAPGNIMAPPN